MLANRGVEPEKIHEFLRGYLHDPNEKTRHWTVEGMAHLGTDETIKDFLDDFSERSFARSARACRMQLGQVGYADP